MIPETSSLSSKDFEQRYGGMCPHGNFLSSCPRCQNRRPRQSEAPDPEIDLRRYEQEPTIEEEHTTANLFEVVSSSTASTKHPERNEDCAAVFRHDNMVMLMDGVAGYQAGEVASRMAREKFSPLYLQVQNEINDLVTKAKTDRETKLNLRKRIEDMIKDSVLASREKTALFNAELLRKINKMPENTPDEVFVEALTLHQTILTLNQKIHEAANNPAMQDWKDMASTITVLKVMEVDGRIFAISLNVGDSETHIKKEGQPLERLSVSDSTLEWLAAGGFLEDVPSDILQNPYKLDEWARQPKNQTKEIFTQTIRQHRFFSTAQMLGTETVKPRLAIAEVGERTKFVIDSDGGGDNLHTQQIDEILTNEPLIEATAKLVKTAGEAASQRDTREDIKGPDDITVMVLEVKRKMADTIEEAYAKWIDEIIIGANLEPIAEGELRQYFESHKQTIARAAVELIKIGRATGSKTQKRALAMVAEKVIKSYKGNRDRLLGVISKPSLRSPPSDHFEAATPHARPSEDHYSAAARKSNHQEGFRN